MRRHPPFPECDGGTGCSAECHFAKLAARPEYAAAWAGVQAPAPAAPARPPCGRLGAPTGALATCAEGCKGVKLRVFACSRHGRCTLEKRGEGVDACCKGCDDYRPAPAAAAATPARGSASIRVNHGALGLGDSLLGLCAVAGLKRDHPDRQIVYRVSGNGAAFVRLFTGWDLIVPHTWDQNLEEQPQEGDDRQMNAGYQPEMRTKNGNDRLERYCQNIGCTRPELPGLREPERLRHLGRDYAGAIFLAPHCTEPNRTYHLHGWLTLERLLLEAGHRVVVIDNSADRLAPFRSEKIVGADRRSDLVVGAVLNAACLVGNDSGLSHLAGILGRPTVVLVGQIHGSRLFGFYPHTKCLHGHLDCQHWRERCDNSCPGLQTILPAEIVATVHERTGGPPVKPSDYAVLDGARLASLTRAVRETAELPGVNAELGCYRGGSALAMARAAPAKLLRLFDTFAGLPADDVGEGIHKQGHFAAPLEGVQKLLAGQRVEYHVGRFPATAAGLAEERYACVHVDGDLYETTRDAIAYFWPRLVPGGRMVFDDLDWPDTPGVARALQEAGLYDRLERPAGWQGVLTK